jgi:hypothetical protein
MHWYMIQMKHNKSFSHTEYPPATLARLPLARASLCVKVCVGERERESVAYMSFALLATAVRYVHVHTYETYMVKILKFSHGIL